MFMGWAALRAALTPGLIPASEPGVVLAAALKALFNLLPILLLIGFLVGSLYLGFASITEAGTTGVLGALLVSVGQRTLTLHGLWQALLGTVRTCSMIGLIPVGALFLSKAMAQIGLPADIAVTVASWGLSPFALILVLLLFYLLLGTMLDGLAAIVMALPVTLPLAVAAGFDPVWFGIFLIITIEMARITPPIGLNLFVIQGLTGENIFRIAARGRTLLRDHDGVHAADHGVPRDRAVRAHLHARLTPLRLRARRATPLPGHSPCCRSARSCSSRPAGRTASARRWPPGRILSAPTSRTPWRPPRSRQPATPRLASCAARTARPRVRCG